tara:strand:+ start:2449 stop:3492 length:1044 start_codon:yes stop_codon:yes gene_type:complete
MTIEYGSGLDPDKDFALTAIHAADPQAMETMNLWAYDAERDIGFNIHPLISGGNMMAMISLFLPDGRILRQRADVGKFTEPSAPGSERVRYACETAFRKWTYRVDALPAFTTGDAQQWDGPVDDERPTAKIDLEMTSTAAAPIWRNGTLTKEAQQMMVGDAGLWVAGRLTNGLHPDSYRYDQLVRVSGRVTLPDGALPFEGVGLRSHARGVRNLVGMAGTCWMSGLFPSGRGFGLLVNHAADGRDGYSEAYTTDGTDITPARILKYPSRHRDREEGDFWIQLASDELGLVDIRGRDLRAFFWSMPEWGARVPPRYGFDSSAGVVMKQALARYEWDGEIGHGLNERSG